MHWYITKIVFGIRFNNSCTINQFDEQVRLITAASAAEAFTKAEQVALSEEGVIMNINDQKLIAWQFINITMLYRISEMIDGAQISSSIVDADNADAYVEAAHQKARHIKNSDTLEILQLV